MKIEKLNENKIRIIVSIDDLKEKNINIQTLMSNSIESQEVFFEMLEEAEKQVGFITKDCKLMIEAIATSEGFFIFTVTKFKSKEQIQDAPKRRLKAMRKNIKKEETLLIYSFDNFDDFVTFCEVTTISKFAKNIKLYKLTDTYYLMFDNIYAEKEKFKNFTANISEFAHLIHNSRNFKFKLQEHGKLIMKHNAINICKKHFCKNLI